jgi:hypothetical protein
MAKIEIERKPRRSLLPLLLALVLIAAVAVGLYYYMERQRAESPAPVDDRPVPPGAMDPRTPPAGLQLPEHRGAQTLHALRARSLA